MRKPDLRQLSLPFFSFGRSASTCAVAAPLPPDPSSAEALEAHRRRIAGFLTMHMSDPVEVTFTQNRSTMISFRKVRGCYHVRLHRMFRHADLTMLRHLLGYLTTKKKSSADAIDEFIARHRDEIDRSGPRRRVTLISNGKHFDLNEVLDRVCRRYFGGTQDVRITWAAAPKRLKRRRRTRTVSRALATYSYEDKIIRVSPVLDAAHVPAYVMDWIVYHELLHHVLPIVRAGARNIYHSKKFRSLERGFEQYESAKAWEDAHMAELLHL